MIACLCIRVKSTIRSSSLVDFDCIQLYRLSGVSFNVFIPISILCLAKEPWISSFARFSVSENSVSVQSKRSRILARVSVLF